jgi:hypothetical protein
MMLSSALRPRTLAVAAVLSAAVIGAGACAAQSATTAAGGQSATSAAAGPSATVTAQRTVGGVRAGTGAPTSDAGTTASGATSAATSGARSAAGSGSGTRACGSRDLKTAEGGGGAAMSHDGMVLIFTNVSGHACTVQGYPGASLVDGSAVLVNAARTLSGYIGDGGRQLTGAPLVRLAPGASASATLEWDANAGEACYANDTGRLEVTPPDTTATVSLESTQVGSEGVCAGFEIHPVVAGIIDQ